MAVITRRAVSASRFATCKPTLKRTFIVRATPEQTPDNAPGVNASAAPQIPPTPVPSTPKAPSFESAMAFSGVAPETINGRLAMLGFTAAVGAELASGTPLLQQFSSATGPVLATFAIFSLASLIPILNGANLKEALGPFRPEAELLNGRLAMIGLVALGVVEVVKGSALF